MLMAGAAIGPILGGTLASIVVLSAMGLALYGIIAWAEKRVIYWQSVAGAEAAAAPA